MGFSAKIPFLALVGCVARLTASDAVLPTAPPTAPVEKSIWMDGIGSGYREQARIIDIRFSRGIGVTYFGGQATHDLLLGRISFAQSINDVWAPDRWYGGNLSFTGEIMGGVQDTPDTAYLIFGTSGLRYDFATKGRLIPYVGLVMGAGATAIGEPDLSEGLQFTEQLEVGLRYFFNERLSATAGIGYLHISNGGNRDPNNGVNCYLLNIGIGWAL